jgi:PAS domain S-box-containing protein
VRTALAWFALSLVLPALVFIALQYRSAVVERRTGVERQAQQYAATIAADIGRELAVNRAQLKALATSSELRRGDFSAFHAQATAALEGSAGRVALLRGDGSHLLNTLRPYGTPLQSSLLVDVARAALLGGQPIESDLFRSTINDQYLVASLIPVGHDDLVLAGPLPVEVMSGVVGNAVPADWLGVVVDRKGDIIARSRNQAQFVGRSASVAFLRQISSRPDGSAETTTLDGIESFTSWQRLPNGWTAAVSVPEPVLEAPMREWAQQVFWNLVFFSVLAMAGAAILGDWISRSIAELEAAAAEIGTGGIATPADTSLRELNAVGEVLSRSSQERVRAEAAIRESDERFRAIFDQSTAGVAVMDLAGRFVVVNARLCDMLGLSSLETNRTTIIDVTHADDRPRARELVRAFSVGDKGEAAEIRWIHHDGRGVWVHVSAAAVRGEDGVARYALAMVLDITERKSAEMANAHLAALVASSGDAIKSVALDGTILTWNRAAERLYGYTADEIVGRPLSILIPDDRLPELEHKIAAARTGQNTRMETLRRRKDGSLVEVSLDAAPIRATDGSVIGISIIARDITERRHSERALMDSEERLRRSLAELEAIYRTAPVGLAVFDTRFRFVHVNNRIAEMDGISPQDHIGRSVVEVIPAIAEQTEAVFRSVMESGKPVLGVEVAGTTGVSPDEPIIWLASWYPLRDAAGEIAAINVVAEDISDRKRAEATLAEREQQFRTLANSIPQLAWMADPDGWIFWYNERWYEYTGATPQEMEGWGWQSLHDPAALPSVLEQFKSSLSTGEPFDMTFPLKGADGVFRPFLTRMVPIRDSRGHIVRWFGTNTDITAQKEHEAHLNFVMRELSHRSKNLLAVVQAMARQTMQHSGDFHDFEGRFMGRLHGLARSHDLLVREDWAGASIRDLVGAQLAPFVREEGASLDISGPDLVLKPDAVQNLGFALFELATNAVKYGALAARHGKVTIHWDLVDAEDGQRVRLQWSESGGPRVKQPERKGFGSVVIERFMAAAFGGKVESGFAPAGFTWSLEIPAEHLLSEMTTVRPAGTAANEPCAKSH